jgi:tRNA uridine 5-carboxymethylaminomethyl modification enzyme
VKAGFKVNSDGVRRDLFAMLAYPDVALDDLGAVWPEVFTWNTDVREQIEIQAAYAGYLDRQRADAESLRKDEDLRLPAELDYAEIGSLSNEVREKLTRVRPMTLGQAARIEGVTPGALTALLAHVRRSRAA